MGINSVLKDISEISGDYDLIKRSGLYPPEDKGKSWDQWRAFEFINSRGHKKANILEVGTLRSRILESLYFKGYRNLYGCDLADIEWRMLIYPYLRKNNYWDLLRSLSGAGPIRFSKQDFLKNNYSPDKFDFVLSLSVIEHGIDIDRYCREVSRLLKPGGYSINSCDYWHEEVGASAVRPFDLPWNVLSREKIDHLLRCAKDCGLELIEPIDFNCDKPIVEWNNKKYTFLFFILRKTAGTSEDRAKC